MRKAVKVFQCSECGLHYENQATMEQCQAWCGEHKSCNLEIAQYSVEQKRKRHEVHLKQ